MTSRTKLALAAALTGLIAWPGIGMQAPDRDGRNQDRDREQMQQQQGRQSFILRRASDLIGANVKNRAGENLGDIKDLAVNLDNGRVPYAVLSYGGVLGIGDKHFAVPFKALNFDRDSHDVVVDIDKERLKEAPGFNIGDWPDFNDEQWAASTNKFYRVERVESTWEDLRGSGGWEAGSAYDQNIDVSRKQTVSGKIQRTDRVAPIAGMSPATIIVIQDAGATHTVHLGPAWFIENQTAALNQGDEVTVKGYTVNIDGRPAIVAYEVLRGGDVLMIRDEGTARPHWTGRAAERSAQRDRQRDISESAETESESMRQGPRLVKCSEIVGMNVVNPQDEDLGEVQDLVIDLDRGRIAYAVLAFGGVLGVNEKYFAMPWKVFKPDRNRNAMVLAIDKDRLKNARGFDRDNWPDMADERWARETHQYYGTQYDDRRDDRDNRDERSRGWDRQDHYGRTFDAKNIDTVDGTIASIERGAPMQGMSEGVIITIRDDDKTIPVHLGPAWYVDRQDLQLNSGAEIKVTGSKVKMAQGEAIIATEIEVNGEKVTLREKDGTPRWTAWRTGGGVDNNHPRDDR